MKADLRVVIAINSSDAFRFKILSDKALIICSVIDEFIL